MCAPDGACRGSTRVRERTPAGSGCILTDETDHCRLFLNIKLQVACEKFHEVTFRDFSERNVETLRCRLSVIDWDFESFGNIDDKVKHFESVVEKCFNSCFPIKTKIISYDHMNEPRITVGIKVSIKKKSDYFKLYQRQFISRETNECYKKLLRKLIKTPKINNFYNFFESCTNNINKSWKGMKNLMGRNRSSKARKPDPIRVNNELCIDDKLIANEFSNYLCSVAHDLDNVIPNA